MNWKRRLSYTISTWFGAGYAPHAPGTVGSLCAMPLAIFVAYRYGWLGLMLAALGLFAIGLPACREVLKETKPDPGFIVIDEVIGQLCSFILIGRWLQGNASAWIFYLLGFLLFRFFDIVKPQPVQWADANLVSAFGVILDDILAGLYTGLTLYLVKIYTILI